MGAFLGGGVELPQIPVGEERNVVPHPGSCESLQRLKKVFAGLSGDENSGSFLLVDSLTHRPAISIFSGTSELCAKLLFVILGSSSGMSLKS